MQCRAAYPRIPSIAMLLFSSGVALAQTADDFFSGNMLHEVRLAIDPADWQKLKANFQSNTYYSCDLSWQGLVVQNIGIRSRGLGSRSGTKPGLRVDFNRYVEDQEFLGLKSFVLDNGTQDPAFIRERISMLLFERLGLPAPRVAHTRLYINDAYAGLYANVESVDKRFLKRVFGEIDGDVENDGYLYEYKWKYNYYFNYLGSDLPPYNEIFEPRTHEDEPLDALLGPIEAMVRAINGGTGQNIQCTMAEYLDLRLFMTYVAIENFLADWDGILGYWGMNNFYLYRFEGRNLSQFIPWDKDNAFQEIDFPVFLRVEENVLMKKAMAVPELRAAYIEALLDCAASAAEPPLDGEPEGGQLQGGWMEREIEREYQQIRAAVEEDRLKPFSNQQFEAAVAYLRRFARERIQFVRSDAEAAQVDPPPAIDLGDITAGGDGTGTASPGIVGINPDTGLFESSHGNGSLGIADGKALTPVADATSPYIDAVFIIDALEMPINSAGVKFAFPAGDVVSPPGTWDHILKDRIGGGDFPVTVGGKTYPRGVGIHSAAGITYDLGAIRDLHGSRSLGTVTAFAGMGDSPPCSGQPGLVTAYVILSNEQEVLSAASHSTSIGGEWLRLCIPDEARFLTLASGAGDGQIRCDAGTFAEAVITPAAVLPPPKPPRNLTAEAGEGKVDLAWDRPSPGPEFTRYRVLRDGVKIADLPVAQRTHTDEGLVNGTPYCYRIRTIRGSSQSTDSNEACATPLGGPSFHRGDPNGNGLADISDAISILSFLFSTGLEPGCKESADVDNDGTISITDGIYSLRFLFMGGPPPASPGPTTAPCGVDPDPRGSAGDLGCLVYEQC